MNTKYNQLKTLMSEISDLTKASGVLGWDRQTKMPPGGAKARARQLSTLRRMVHERYAGDQMGDLLEELDHWVHSLVPDSDELGLIRLARREYTIRRAVPADLVVEMSKVSGEGFITWREARTNDDFAAFLPTLERIFDLSKQYAACFPNVEHPYDALLDRFEPEMTSANLKRIFGEIKAPQTELLHAITERGTEVDNSILHQHFDHDTQLAAALEATQILGYDLQRGRLDLTTHPFASSFSVNDARITTRVDENFLNACLFATMHESGHALYELGVAPHLDGLPLARGTSSGVHESQSRLFENLIGRSRAFSGYLLPMLQKHFPSQLGAVSVEDFYRAINKSKPSLIRVEADEVSYNLHIILRFEIELAIIDGDLEPKDLPEAWNAKMQEMLGVTPPNDRLGVLQDVHWSTGLIGHFSSYAMGNIIASQLWAAMGNDIPNQDELMAVGNITPLREWLIEKVHRHGKKYPTNELIQRITGSKIETEPYLNYLKNKYSEIYNL